MQEIARYSQEIVFKTSEKAPSDFNEWTFFWTMPRIDEGAKLDYVVIQPDGKEYFQYDMPDHSPGTHIRSDFREGFAGGNPSVFHNQHIIFKVRVTKGEMKFDPSTKFAFEFRRVPRIQAVADIDNSALYWGSSEK